MIVNGDELASEDRVAARALSGRTPRVGLLVHQLDSRLTGVGRYMASLTAELCRGAYDVEIFPLVVGPLGPLESDPDVFGRITAETQIQALLALAQRASQVAGHRASFLTIGSALASAAARRLQLDAVHDLTGIAPFLLPTGRCRRVITVHDLISYVPGGGNDFVDVALQRRWLPRAARAAHGIVAVSAVTGADVRRWLHVPAGRIHVAQHGVDPHYRVLPGEDVVRTLVRYGLQPGYILFVGSASPRKNLARLVQACRLMWAGGLNIRLVVVGPAHARAVPGALDDIAAGRISWIGYVAESDLPILYNGAAVVAFPSTYEGFGLPALEAMSCGTPVLAGRAGALAEVVGDAGVLVNPLDAHAMARELLGLLEHSARRERVRALGLARSRAFTWSRTARDTVKAYQHVLGVHAD